MYGYGLIIKMATLLLFIILEVAFFLDKFSSHVIVNKRLLGAFLVRKRSGNLRQIEVEFTKHRESSSRESWE
jgi:hypothetical protein